MKLPEFMEWTWEFVQWAWQALWYGAGAIILLLLFVEFVLGIDFIAWIVGDPFGDIGSWIQGMNDGAREAVREKINRIGDSYNNR